MSMRRGFLEEDTMAPEPEPTHKPRRRWRLHYQFPGKPKAVHLFEVKTDALKQFTKLQARGARVMIEDSWNEQ